MRGESSINGRELTMKVAPDVNNTAIGVGVVVLVALVTLSVIPLAARSGARQGFVGTVDVNLTQPVVVSTGNNPLEVVVKGPDGEAINDADVHASFVMSAWPIKRIPETRTDLSLSPAGEGRYIGVWSVAVAGPWVTRIVVRRNGFEIGRKKFVLTVE
jgi:hypothetical protein